MKNKVVKKEITFNGRTGIGHFIVVDMDAKNNSLHMFDFEYLDDAVDMYFQMKDSNANPRIYRSFSASRGKN